MTPDAGSRMRYHRAVARSRCRRTPGALFAVGLCVGAACEIVDPGPEVGVAGRCVVSAQFFVERIVPEYLEKHDCRNAGDGGCHDIDNGNSIFRLRDTSDVLPPLPTDPLAAWPESWQLNFEATTAQLINCDNAELAPLWSEPAGGDTLKHGGGDLFADDDPELELIEEWLASGA